MYLAQDVSACSWPCAFRGITSGRSQVPLFLTAQAVHTNVWSYMTFGSLYANWLCLIHSEVSHPWDAMFLACGLGTAGDHHVHHSLFTWNYGHLFTYCDRLAGTYKAPSEVAKFTSISD